jgi:RNA polymerase sigma-70 factor (ECF subfamily)
MQNIDISTIHACQQGDRDAFQLLYEAFNRKIYRLIYRYTNDPEEASDLTHEAFIRIYTGIRNFRSECSLETWIHRIAANTAIGSTRKSRSLDSALEDARNLAEPSARPDAQLEMQELDETIRRAIAKLPDSLRMAFILVAIEHYTYTEAAEILKIGIDALRMRVSRALQMLQKTLKPYLNGGIMK